MNIALVHIESSLASALRAAVEGSGGSVAVVDSSSQLTADSLSSFNVIAVGTVWPNKGAAAAWCARARTLFPNVAIVGVQERAAGWFESASLSVFVSALVEGPIGAGVLETLRHAAHNPMKLDISANRTTEELRRALGALESGELVVRAGSVVATIHVQDGHVVWAQLSTSPASLEEVLRHANTKLDADTIEAITQEATSKGVHFLDVLISWGLLEDSHGLNALRKHIADRVHQILALPDSQCLFLPKPFRRVQRFRFRASELFRSNVTLLRSLDPATGKPSVAISSNAPLREEESLVVTQILNETLAIDGVTAAAVIVRSSGDFARKAGAVLDEAMARKCVDVFRQLDETGDEVLAVSKEHCYILRTVTGAHRFLLFAQATLTTSSFGYLRRALSLIQLPDAPA